MPDSPRQIVHVPLGVRSYDIVIGENLLESAGERLKAMFPGRRFGIVTDTEVASAQLPRLIAALDRAGLQHATITVPNGEASKSFARLGEVVEAILAAKLERGDLVIALGGGVIGDLAGFAAAIARRGMDFIQMPTSLLAQVDSSVGGKTAINHPLGKNMIGAFHQPTAVLADIATLDTLPQRELAAGLAEVIKYGIIGDPAFFEWLEANIDRLVARDPEALTWAVRRSCENKAAVVAVDERETGPRAMLNLGHTFGHAIETGLGFGVWLHGEAVAAGMVLAARTSVELGELDPSQLHRIERLLVRAGLPVEAPDLGFERWLALMGHDKKVESGAIRFILPRGIGAAFIHGSVPHKLLQQVLTPSVSHA